MIWQRLYSSKSTTEKGTIYQLINRSSVPSDPENGIRAAEDHLLLLLHTHVVAAAKHLLLCNPTECVSELAKYIIVNYVHWPLSGADRPACFRAKESSAPVVPLHQHQGISGR